MKKTVVIIAIALGFSFNPLNAANEFNALNSESVVLEFARVNPFCKAIAKGDIETVRKLIELGSDVNQKSNGMTPIQVAAKFNRCKIIKLLVNDGASINKKSDRGMRAKKYAKLSIA